MFIELGVSENSLTWSCFPARDLNLTSLELTMLLIRLEKHFDIVILEDEWMEVTDYFSLVSFVAEKLHRKQLDYQ